MGVPLPRRLGSLGERHKLPQRGPGQIPGRKTSFGVFRAWKKTHLASLPLTFSIFPDHFGIPWLFQVFQVSGQRAGKLFQTLTLTLVHSSVSPIGWQPIIPMIWRIWAKFFCELIVRVWNNLADNVDFSTLASFTRTIKRVDFSKYLRYSY